MSKKSDLIPVRLSHLLRHCAVGAIVRGPEYLMTVKDIREWTDKHGNPAGEPIRYVDQVRSALGITQELREPPIARELNNSQIDGACVPAVRFPSWMRCPKCGLLHYKPWKGLQAGEKPRCQENNPNKCSDKPELEQVPWILVHKDGHMADVPWHFLAHPEGGKGTQVQKQCRSDWSEPYLRLIDQGASKRRLRCMRCAAEKEFDDLEHIPFGSAWRQPWLNEQVTTEESAVILEINDARVHSPVTRNALVIPPESRIRKGSVVDRLYRNSQKLRKLEQARNPLARKAAMQVLATEFRCTVENIESALCEIAKGYPSYGKNLTLGHLLESEYQAFLDELPDMADDEDFVTKHHTRAWKSNIGHLPEGSKLCRIAAAVSHLIAVNRLKEIMVLKGFVRLGGNPGTPVPPDIEGKSDWLPALELYGEGIFFNLEEGLLRQWENHTAVQERADDFQRRFATTGLRFDPEVIVTPRFLLLHTLAHLLVRQLETQAGYPAASLKERIYYTAGKMPMAGILVYVAVPDVVGSLGGLAELAAPDRFLPLLTSVFDHAEWCSLDPVCSEHGGQGPSLLNRAACHACALIPEPSCAYGNVLLDRAFIKGDLATGMPAFLDTADSYVGKNSR